MRHIPNTIAGHRRPLSRIAHVVERIGLAMAGALCGLFVAAHVMRANIPPLDSMGFIALMCLVGIAGFYLGIDMPRGRRSQDRALIDMLGAFGTFVAAVAAVISVYVIVFDDTPRPAWVLVIGGGWVLGASLQIGAGAIARLRWARPLAG